MLRLHYIHGICLLGLYCTCNYLGFNFFDKNPCKLAWEIAYVLVGRCLATKVFIGKLPGVGGHSIDERESWANMIVARP